MNVVRFSVKSISKLSESIFSVILEPECSLGEFKAGQYLDIILPGNKKASFSIATPPECRNRIELNIGPVNIRYSSKVLEYLTENEQVEVEFPKGHCFLEHESLADDKQILLLAGGTGFSQITSIVEHLIGNQVKNPISVYWGVSSKEDFYKEDIIEGWLRRNSNINFVPVVSSANSSSSWEGRAGLLPDIVTKDFDDFTDFEVIASGPISMVYTLLQLGESKGLSKGNLRSDALDFAD